MRLWRWGYRVVYYQWDDFRKIKPRDGDVLVGHPHYAPLTVYRRSVRSDGWRRRIAMFPFSHGETGYSAFADDAVRHSDLVLAIAGRYWLQTAPQSVYAHWCPKLIHQDLAIDRNDFPIVKHRFNPPGRRRVVYIGHTSSYKNPRFLSRIALAMPDVEFSWVGGSYNGMTLDGFKHLGGFDFSRPEGREVIAGHRRPKRPQSNHHPRSHGLGIDPGLHARERLLRLPLHPQRPARRRRRRGPRLARAAGNARISPRRNAP
jgi:hypothetical protein